MRLDHSSKAQIEYNFREEGRLMPNEKTSMNKVTGVTAPMFKNSIYIIPLNNQMLSYFT